MKVIHIECDSGEVQHLYATSGGNYGIINLRAGHTIAVDLCGAVMFSNC